MRIICYKLNVFLDTLLPEAYPNLLTASYVIYIFYTLSISTFYIDLLCRYPCYYFVIQKRVFKLSTGFIMYIVLCLRHVIKFGMLTDRFSRHCPRNKICNYLILKIYILQKYCSCNFYNCSHKFIKFRTKITKTE